MQGKRQSSHAKFLKTPDQLISQGHRVRGSQGHRSIFSPGRENCQWTCTDCKCRSTGNKEVAKQKRLEGLTGPGRTVPVSCYEEGSPAIPTPPRWTLFSVTHDRCVPLPNLP